MVRRVTLVSGSPVVELETVVFKNQVRAKESAHLAFPFNVTNPTIRADEGGAIVVPERNQLPGSCRDFIGVHSAVDVSGSGYGVALASLDAPLVELGAMTDETQDPKARVRGWRTKTAAGSTVYAYLLNNYWHTNYKADQEGPLSFRFAVRPHGADADDVALRRFGAEQEQPLIAYVVDADAKPARAPFLVEGGGVMVSSIRAEATSDGKTATGARLVRLYNASSRPATARLSSRGGAPVRAEYAQDSRTLPNAGVTLPPFGTILLRVVAR